MNLQLLMSKKSKISILLEELKIAGYHVDKGSKARSWLKRLFIHVAQLITPFTGEGGDDITYQIVRNLIDNITEKDYKLSRLPLICEVSPIAEIKQKTVPVFSTMEQENYDVMDTHLGNSMSMDFTGAIKEHSSPILLVGYLSTAGSIKKHLYICDKSDRILCHMVAPTPELLNTVVLIKKWRIVPPEVDIFPGVFSYIEVLSEPVILHKPTLLTKVIDPKRLKSYEGYVTSVSSCLDVTQWRFNINFVCENVESKTASKSLLLKNDFAFWASCVHRGDRIKLSNLKSASLTIEERKFDVLVPTSCSELYVESAILNNQTFSMDDIHRQMNHIFQLHSTTEKGICPVYLGEITLVKSAEFGIYMLDDKVFLHCAYNISGDLGCALRPGALILVVKAHVCKGCDGRIHLVCCTRTALNIIRHSQSTTSWQPCCVAGNILIQKFLLFEPFLQHPITTSRLPNFLKKLCTNYGFSLRKLLPIATSSDTDNNEFKVLKRLLFKDKLNNKISTFGSRQSFTEELSDSHNEHCIVNKMLKKTPKEYHLITIRELIDITLEKAEMQHHYSKPGEKCLWSYCVISDVEMSSDDNMTYYDTMFLLGNLSLEEKTGSIIFNDSTAFLNLIILKKDVGTVASTLHANDNGSFVRITKFQIVVEFTTKLKPPILTCLQDISEASLLPDSSMFDDPTQKLYMVCDSSDVEILRGFNGFVDECSRYLDYCNEEQNNYIATKEPGTYTFPEQNATKQGHRQESHTSPDYVFNVSEITFNPPAPSCYVNVRGTVESRIVYEESYTMQTKVIIFDTITRMSICVFIGELSKLDEMVGILPGCIVVFYNIKVMISSQGIVCGKFDDNSSMKLECLDLSTTMYNIPVSEANIRSNNNEIDFSEVPCNLLVQTYSNEVKYELIKVTISPIKILNVVVSFQHDSPRFNEESSMFFYAKCSITDATAKMFLHFYTHTMDCFFRFLKIPNVVQKDFIRVCEESKLSQIEYDSILHDKYNIITEFDTSARNSLPQQYLTHLCNHANDLILPRKEVIARRLVKQEVDGFKTEDYFEHGTTAVGSQGQDHMHSVNLKLLHFNCVHVI